MPSPEPLPTLSDLLGAFGDGVRGLRDPNADTRRGAAYDHWAGAGALLFSREATRDRDMFRAISFDTAEGAQLATIARRRFGIEPVTATFSQGSARVVRASAAAGAGTFFAGTRFSVLRTGAAPSTYAVRADVRVDAAATDARIPIRALTKGSGTAIDARAGLDVALCIDDPLWDTSWQVTSLACEDGADAESPQQLRARARQAQLDARKGYAKAMSDACVAAGAANVALFASSYLGD